MKTYLSTNEEHKVKWHVIDAKNEVLGRLATKTALLLRGKHKVTYTPHVDLGDGVIIVNAEKVKVTGGKLEQKQYKRFSGYPGGYTEEPMERLMARRPTDILRHAVKGMLPKSRLGRKMIRRLKIYAGAVHPHEAQTADVKDKNVKKAKKEDK